MINYARTLLLNRRSENQILDLDGQEYIDSSFEPVAEASEVVKLKNVLFGTAPDRLTLNYRAAQYMEILHGDPFLAPYVTALDERITYDIDYWANFGFGAVINEVSATDCSLRVIGKPRGLEANGWHSFNYQVIVTRAGTSPVMTVEQLAPVHYTYSDTLSTADRVYLDLVVGVEQQDIGLKLELDQSQAPTTAVGLWDVVLKIQPTKSLVEIAEEVDSLGVYNWAWPRVNRDPYPMLLNMVKNGETPVRRLGAAVLLVILRNYEAYADR